MLISEQGSEKDGLIIYISPFYRVNLRQQAPAANTSGKFV